MTMATEPSRSPSTGAERSSLGRVISVNGAQARVTITPADLTKGDNATVTVGKFLAISGRTSINIGLITEIAEERIGSEYRSVAQIDLIGEIKGSDASGPFQRGVAEYPIIGDAASLMNE